MTNKKHGVLRAWNDLRGFGWVAGRDEFGSRISWFLHISRIQKIEGGGIPVVGSDVFFDEEVHPKGKMAVNAEISRPEGRIHRHAGLKSLAGHEDGGVE